MGVLENKKFGGIFGQCYVFINDSKNRLEHLNKILGKDGKSADNADSTAPADNADSTAPDNKKEKPEKEKPEKEGDNDEEGDKPEEGSKKETPTKEELDRLSNLADNGGNPDNGTGKEMDYKSAMLTLYKENRKLRAKLK